LIITIFLQPVRKARAYADAIANIIIAVAAPHHNVISLLRYAIRALLIFFAFSSPRR